MKTELPPYRICIELEATLSTLPSSQTSHLGLTLYRGYRRSLARRHGLAREQNGRHETRQWKQNYDLLGRGTSISFPDLDVGLYVTRAD